ncbi:amino acid ABC transporter permease [Thorsellia kenyensis]|uniref:Amino acid ABC transporter permease n=1 Tax=Thorsellia kenyensis TaxID=1549888 RepID=A0ABV6CB95_9GAMM
MKNIHTLKIVKARYPNRIIGGILAILIFAIVIQSIAFNPRWEWSIFGQWLFDPVILSGLVNTLSLMTVCTALSLVLGGLLAIARLSDSRLLNTLAFGYIWLFRSLPLIVVLIILYNFSYLYESLSIGIPFTKITFAQFDTINVLSQYSTAVIGLTLVQSAYTAEIIRGGFIGVDRGQYEAAFALGLPAHRRITRIILPQALRTILPSGFNEIISLAKGTAMVYVLAMPELFYTIQMIYNRTQDVIPLLMVAAAWYVIITSVLSLLQFWVEKILSRSERSHKSHRIDFQEISSTHAEPQFEENTADFIRPKGERYATS